MTADAVVVARAVGARPWKIAPRSPTLGGTIPLRAAQSCPPLLAGNAFGLGLSLPAPLRLKRGLRGVTVEPAAFAGVTARVRDGASVEIALDTGLVIDDVPGAALVVERPFNRRDLRVGVAAARVTPGTPLVVRLIVAARRGESVELRGEVATLGLFVEAPPIAVVPLSAAPDVARAHTAFFDATYFAGKRGSPTRKYRRLLGERPDATARPGPGVFVVHAGGAPPCIERGPDGVAAIVLPVEARCVLSFHGLRVEVGLDAEAVARRARSIETAFREVFGEPIGDGIGDGALRYFTTYVTPHVSGDPHAFFKPATLVAAPEDWRLVVDGPEADGLEGLRGVTEPAWFHALPAVARLLGTTAKLSVSSPAPVVRARFTRAAWASPGIAVQR